MDTHRTPRAASVIASLGSAVRLLGRTAPLWGVLACGSAGGPFEATATDSKALVATCPGTPVTLASTGAAALVSDGANVYFSDAFGDGAIRACPVSGCKGAPLVLASGQHAVGTIAVDADNVYWANYLPDTLPTGTIMMCAKTGCGGSPTVLAAAQAGSFSVAVDGSNVYWNNLRGGGSVMKCAKSGCNQKPTLLVALPISVGEVATDGTNVYFSDGNNIQSCATAGCNGKATVLAAGVAAHGGIAIDSSNVYWDAAQSGSIMKVAKSGAFAPVVLAAGQAQPTSVATDGKKVYWTDNASGAVMAVGVAGGVASTVYSASAPFAPIAIAVDQTNVYFTTTFDSASSVVEVATAGQACSGPLVCPSTMLNCGDYCAPKKLGCQ